MQEFLKVQKRYFLAVLHFSLCTIIKICAIIHNVRAFTKSYLFRNVKFQLLFREGRKRAIRKRNRILNVCCGLTFLSKKQRILAKYRLVTSVQSLYMQSSHKKKRVCMADIFT